MQLFALARATLRRLEITEENAACMPVLLLDEAMSSVDAETEAIMLQVIQKEFREKGHTVVSVTHRSTTFVETEHSRKERIMVLSHGRVERLGRAEDVLGDSNSL
jgi:ATP-binding cassette, subfamily C (CFTR/MRP), member 1